MTPARSPGWASPPVLIQVPALSAGPHLRPARRGPRPTPARRRRRLRREVKLAGVGMLFGLPLTALALALALGGGRLGAAQARASATVSAAVDAVAEDVDAARAVLVEGAAWEPAPPVMLTGYLLPADETEDPAHAGP